MFKVTVLTQNLKTAVSLASHAVSNRSQLPILLNFLLETKGGELYISATDLEIGIKIKTPAKIEKEGQVCVMAKTFLDLISNIDQEKITLTQEEKILILEGNKIKTRFPTTPPEDFPALYKQRGEKQAEFKKEEFDRLVQRIVFSSAQDLGRPALSGVLIKGEGEKLTIVATDGYRLSLNQGILEAKKGSGESLLVPARVIREVVGLKQGGKTIVLYTSKENNQVLF
ncbi:MAG: DNA polymerase III subunit beta, partial [Candidatus Levybacteria bacterium]|nr:DNA polymerase III subunit beta [Candidatus Levybacteria bacterium]